MYTEWTPTPNILSSSLVCRADLEFVIETENNPVATKILIATTFQASAIIAGYLNQSGHNHCWPSARAASNLLKFSHKRSPKIVHCVRFDIIYNTELNSLTRKSAHFGNFHKHHTSAIKSASEQCLNFSKPLCTSIKIYRAMLALSTWFSIC